MSETTAILTADELSLPPKPEEPLAGECCGRGCINCVWIYYERALERWQQKCDELNAQRSTAERDATKATEP